MEEHKLRKKFLIDDKSHDNDNKPTRHTAHFFGMLQLLLTFALFGGSMYAIVISKWMPETGNEVLDWIKEDTYYCLLIPLLLPISFVFIYINWMSLKFFRHN